MSTGFPSARWEFEPNLLDRDVPPSPRRPPIEYPRPTWIFWDVGLTLVYPSASLLHDELKLRFPALRRQPQEILGALVVAAEARHPRWPPALSGDERVCLAWATLLGLPAEEGGAVLAACLARHDLYRAVDADARPVLAELAAHGVRMGAISNSDGTLNEELAHFGLESYFDVLVDSERVGVEKPDPAIFRIALEQAGVRPEEAWHVGDGLVNDYLAAKKGGLSPILLDRYDRCQGALPVQRISVLPELLEVVALAGERPAAD